MPYRDNRFWDPKKGWVRPKKEWVIERKTPINDVTSEEMEEMSKAPLSEEWETKGKGFWREGYKKGTNPYDRFVKYVTKKQRFERINKWLNRIPYVKVKVIEQEDTTKNPFTRRD